MIHNGFSKLADVQGFASGVVSFIGLPYPVFLTYCAAYAEIVSSILLAVGLIYSTQCLDPAIYHADCDILSSQEGRLAHSPVGDGFPICPVVRLLLDQWWWFSLPRHGDRKLAEEILLSMTWSMGLDFGG